VAAAAAAAAMLYYVLSVWCAVRARGGGRPRRAAAERKSNERPSRCGPEKPGGRLCGGLPRLRADIYRTSCVDAS
jgi:hypothetical protein